MIENPDIVLLIVAPDCSLLLLFGRAGMTVHMQHGLKVVGKLTVSRN